ncbi:MAG: metal ABC transporter permease [Clostridia bacterium]|nr:metal ABC transporter permease [Clostridia bacterium]
MPEFIENLVLSLSLPFAIYALICTALVSVCASLLGTTLVLKRFSFIGDGLSHVAFGALAIATVLHIAEDMALVLPLTIVCAILILRLGQSTKVKGDAAIAMLSVTALAVGYLLLNKFQTGSNIAGDVCTALFGATNIVVLKMSDVIISLVMCVLTILFFVLFYNKIFSVTFDENFASATGTNVKLINTATAVIIAIVIVLAMKLVGSLLISALVVFPALSAMRVCRSFRSVTICSAVIALSTSVCGILLSIMIDTPVGATIVALQALIFAAFFVIGVIKRK